MSKTVSVEITPENDFVIDWGGDLEGICCGSESSALRKKLAKLGIQLEPKEVLCRLPQADSVMAKNNGICIINLKKGEASV